MVWRQVYHQQKWSSVSALETPLVQFFLWRYLQCWRTIHFKQSEPMTLTSYILKFGFSVHRKVLTTSSVQSVQNTPRSIAPMKPYLSLYLKEIDRLGSMMTQVFIRNSRREIIRSSTHVYTYFNVRNMKKKRKNFLYLQTAVLVKVRISSQQKCYLFLQRETKFSCT